MAEKSRIREEGKKFEEPKAKSERDALTGTTRRVYRYIYRHGPVRLHDIQRDLELSSSSVADYHIQKLLRMNLILKEEGADNVGYVAEESVFEAMIRIRRAVIPLWTTAAAFFSASLFVLFTILRPKVVSSTYSFSIFAITVALAISLYVTLRSLEDP